MCAINISFSDVSKVNIILGVDPPLFKQVQGETSFQDRINLLRGNLCPLKSTFLFLRASVSFSTLTCAAIGRTTKRYRKQCARIQKCMRLSICNNIIHVSLLVINSPMHGCGSIK